MMTNHNPLENVKKVKINSYEYEEMDQWKLKISNNNHLTCLHVNINSIKKHWDTLLLTLENMLSVIDVLVLTEINVVEEEASILNIPQFKQITKCRIKKPGGGLGGGIAVYYRDCFTIEEIRYNFDCAENINFRIVDQKKKVQYLILAIYRPPNNNINSFLTDLQWWLTNSTRKTESIIIIGDINICMKKKTPQSANYTSILSSHGLLPTIKAITREEMRAGNLQRSCIDHINIRLKYKHEIASALIRDKIADHYFVGIQIYTTDPLKAQQERLKLNEVKYVQIRNEKQIQQKLAHYDWSEILKIEEPEEIYRKVSIVFNNIYEENSILKPRTKKDDLFPWVSIEIKNHIMEKKMLFQRWRNNKNNVLLYEHYKNKRNEVTNMIKKSKRIYIFKKLRDTKGNMQKMWRVLNFNLDKKQREPNEAILTKHFETNNFGKLSNSFNENFKNQIKKLKQDNNGPRFFTEYNEHEPQENVTSLFIKPPSITDISKIIKELRTTGPGIDKILPADVKNNSSALEPIITHLMRRIVLTERIPTGMKISCITPLYKKGDVKNFGNYRPVGSLCFFEKILEKYLETKSKKYLMENKIIAPFQYGFQPQKSTITLLDDFSEILNHALDRRKYVIILWLDLTRAFETLSHENLLKKFKSIGLHNKIFKNYLEDRTQVTKVGQVFSGKLTIEDGLVTGGIVSPGWFNIYTHDIQYLPLKSRLLMFADDSCIVSVHHNLELAVKNAQDDFIKIQKYFYSNEIYINESKTEAMALGTAKGMADIQNHRIKCHSRSCLYLELYKSECQCEYLTYVENCRYLGVNIDDTFKMKTHVNILCKKLRVINYQFRKSNVAILSSSTKTLLYHALVESILRYGVTLYTYSPQYILDPLSSVQKKILQYLFKNKCENFLQPQTLAKFVTIVNNFKKPEFREQKITQYPIRNKNFISSIAYTKYGERLLSFCMPKFLNIYCKDYLNEDKMYRVKEELKKQLLQEQRE